MALLVVKLIGHAYCIMPRIRKAVNAAAMATNVEYAPHSCRLYRERITRIIPTEISPSYVTCHTLKSCAMMRVYGSTRIISRWRKVQSISYRLLCTSSIRVDPPHQTSGAVVVHSPAYDPHGREVHIGT
jgi:hypothetical protein